MILYLVTMEAVYDHGCVGVYDTLDAAYERARDLFEHSDGHHSFRVEKVRLGESIEPRSTLGRPRGLLRENTRIDYEPRSTG